MHTLEIMNHEKNGHRLTCSVTLSAPLKEAFDFFSDASNLEAITPDSLRFSIVEGQDLVMRVGLEIDYRLRIHGIPARWRSIISKWEPPFAFVDEQVRGPYRSWHHLHTFHAVDDNMTRVEDVVTYQCPGGGLIHKLFVRRSLEHIFAYRSACLLQEFRATAT